MTKQRPPFVAVALLMNGDHHKLTQEVYNQLLEAAESDAIVPDPSKLNFFRKSGVTEVLSLEDYEKMHPEKKPELGRQVPISYSGNRLHSVTVICDQFRWIQEAFNFFQLEELVNKAWDKMNRLETEAEFRSFCIRHKALMPDGSVSASNYTDKHGREQWVTWAYSLFREIWKAIEAGRQKAGWVAEKSFEGMDIEIPDSGISHIENLAKGLKLTNSNYPLLQAMRERARQIKAMAATVDKAS